MEAIDRQLMHRPNIKTRNRKPLTGFQADYEHGEVVWELRVGTYRVYYDVVEQSKTVVIRAVREKSPHMTTEQIT